MLAVALASGSNGNAIHVQTEDASLLFDAGVSGKLLERRGLARGVDVAQVDAVLLSHSHGDHVSGVGVIARRYGTPVRATAATWRRIGTRLGPIEERGRFRAGETIPFGRTLVHTIPTPHDAEGSVAFVVEAEGVKLGVLTDLGHPHPRLLDVFGELDGAFLESNYDPEMLARGPYPWFLKDRIAGPGGHISNTQCADIVATAAKPDLQFVVLSHLSGNCDAPGLALACTGDRVTDGPDVHLAPRDDASPRLSLGT